MRNLSSLLLLTLASAGLAGCGVNSSQLAPSQPILTSVGNISGTVFGGRQPISGARLFLMAVGTTGYGTASTSLITAAGGGTQNMLTTGGYGEFANDYYVPTTASGSFNLTGTYTCTAGQAVYLVSIGGDTGGGADNPYAGLMATLGICPASGSLATNVPHVEINEVSTVATAFALSGFATNVAAISQGNTSLSVTGLTNAVVNANLLFNAIAATPTYGGGAALTTPNGNGTIPQALINSLANSLAACVNSVPSGSAPSASCTTLFTDTNTGTAPVDTASAVINIAHNPAANVGDIFALAPNSVQPYTPNLGTTAPFDFSVAILYSATGINSPQQIAIDSNGAAWIESAAGGKLVALDPTGAPLSSTGSPAFNGSVGDGLAIGPNGNIWLDDSSCASGKPCVYVYNGSGGAIGGSPFSFGTTLQGAGGFGFDALGNAYIPGSTSNNIVELSKTGAYQSQFSSTSVSTPLALVHDGTFNLWVANATGLYEFPDSTNGSGATPAASATITFSKGDRLAVDSSSNIWSTGRSSNLAYETTSNGSPGSNSPYTISKPSGIAIDGLNTVFVASFVTKGGVYVIVNNALLSPYTGFKGYRGTGSYVYQPAGVAVDPSGNVWVASTNNSAGTNSNYVAEYIGLGAPTTTPILPGGFGSRP